MSADTIVPQAGNPQSLNRYSYCYNSPVNCIDPSGHDVVFVNGANTDADLDKQLLDWEQWIMAYKGWTMDQFADFMTGFRSAADQMGYIKGQGIGMYNTNEPVNDAMLNGLATYMSGMQDVTLVGFSKGANVVMSYIAARENGRFSSDPDVSKFALINAPYPGGAVNGYVQGATPGAPFSQAKVCFAWPCESMDSLSNGQVVNVYSPADIIGNMHDMPGGGATNIVSHEPGHSPGYNLPPLLVHGHSSYTDAMATFGALNVSGDYNAYYDGPGR